MGDSLDAKNDAHNHPAQLAGAPNMTYNQSIYWQLREAPSPNTVRFSEEDPVNLQEVIPSFLITLPLCLTDSAMRLFPGGTFLSLLQMIYEFYQEPVPSEEIHRVMNLSNNRNRNRMIRLAERQEAGEILRRIDILDPSATYEGIRESVLLVD